jgi:hypothetical protein
MVQGAGNSVQESEMKRESESGAGIDDDRSMAAGNVEEVRKRYDKIKNVFKLLIDEAPFLIDDICFEKAEGKTLKE